MKSHAIIVVAIVAVMAVPVAAYADEGANTGNATSTLAGPAGDNKGPSKGTNPSTGAGSSMKSGASGAGENKPTATGGQPGGAAGRN